MSIAESLGMIRLEDTVNPLSWRYNLSTHFGVTSQTLTLDVPDIGNDLGSAMVLGARIWTDHIASAITSDCSLDFIELIRWKQGPLPIVGAAPSRLFASHLPPTGKFDSGLAVLHTGDKDAYGRSRFYLPAMPQAWVTEHRLNAAGWRNLHDWAAVLFMGLSEFAGGSPMRWLIAYNNVAKVDLANLTGVAFRRVAAIRICDYCDKAPDQVPVNWP